MSINLIYFLTLFCYSLSIECEQGKYGETCESDCDPHCDVQRQNCDQQTGACTYCRDGYFNNKNNPIECLKCSDTCKLTCTAEQCTECKEDKGYGKFCDKECSNCKYDDTAKKYCDREGICVGACEKGFYGDMCEDKCLNCKVECSKSDGKCTECEEGYYPPFCKECNKKCLLCESEKKCTKCIDRELYGSLCENTCNENCFDDKEKETKCDLETGNCFSCNEGFFGDKCDKKCLDENCIKCDKTSGLCLQCDINFYLNDDKGCTKCNDNCDRCTKDKCIECKRGDFYGDLCDKECPLHCSIDSILKRKCDRDSGKCVYGCEEFFTGELCDSCILGKKGTNCTEKCSEGCDLEQGNCDKETGECPVCKEGKWGKECDQSCPENCAKCSKDGTCEECKEDFYLNPEKKCIACAENCEGGCTIQGCTSCKEDKFYGEWCDSPCPERCEKSQCDRKGNCTCQEFFEGEKCDHCEFGHTGYDCKDLCNEGCDINKEKGINCNQDGTCDCKIGFFDYKCDQKCNANCDLKDGNCDKVSGSCSKCKDGYYGTQCEKQCTPNCIKCDINSGDCLQCQDKFFIFEGLCEKCSNNCLDSTCNSTTGRCEKCSKNDQYGPFCNSTCPLHCAMNTTEDRKCDRETGVCESCEPNFDGVKCDTCIDGKYGENCENPCPEHCAGTKKCDITTGACESCENGYWSELCDLECDHHCDIAKFNCLKKDGQCTSCQDGYYVKDRNCSSCFENCEYKCTETQCERCKVGWFGDKCTIECNSQCKDRECDQKSGACHDCNEGSYGETCDKDCNGCLGGCNKKNGVCNLHECKEGYYNPLTCGEQCNVVCKEKKCDLYTGECIECEGKRWGNMCQYKCSSKCDDDLRVDCCYANQNEIQYKSINISTTVSQNILKKSTIPKISFLFGEHKIAIDAYVDFDSNSPLVVFDKANPPTMTKGSINTNPQYNASDSKTYKPVSDVVIDTSKFNYISIDGVYATESLTLATGETMTVHFLKGQSVSVDPKFSISEEVNAFIGLGFLNFFNEDLIAEKKIDKNIMSYDNTTKSFLFGDYTQLIKEQFTKMTTLIPLNPIKYNAGYTIKAKLRGFAYSNRKAYRDEQNITLSFGATSSFIFSTVLQPFFEKIFFGSLFNNGCVLIEKAKDLKEFLCTNEAYNNNEMEKFGIIIDDYIYYLPKTLLFVKQSDGYHFQIQLKKKAEIVLGKEFIEYFPFVINSGNGTLGFIGDTKKLNIPLLEIPSEWPDTNSGDYFTPGTIALFVIFSIVGLLIVIYIARICMRRNKEIDFEDSFFEKKEIN